MAVSKFFVAPINSGYIAVGDILEMPYISNLKTRTTLVASTTALLTSLVQPTFAAQPEAFAEPGKTNLNGFLTPINDQLDSEEKKSEDKSPDSKSLDTASAEDVNEAGQVYSLRASKNVEGTGRWSLPFYGQLSKATSLIRTATKSAARAILSDDENAPSLEVGISMSDQHSQMKKHLDNLLGSALDHDEKSAQLDKAVRHYNTTAQKVIAEVKDGADYLVPFRGFGPSSEAGNVILDEKVKVHSRASAEYARQKNIDEKHLQIVTSMSQIAMGIGMADKVRGSQIVESGKKTLTELVGEDETNKTLSLLNNWSRELDVPESIYKQGPWDVQNRQEKLKTVVATSLDNDAVIAEIKRKLHKYNQKSKFSMVASSVVQTTLGTVSLCPTFVGPAAKVALLSFVMATGGPESCKLMKELYLDKRFESRYKVTTEEAHMALENYHIAVLTRNPVLLAFSESMIAEMAGRTSVTSVLGAEVLAYANDPNSASTEVLIQNDADNKSLAQVQKVTTQ